MRTVKFLTLGCKVNQYETQQIRERLMAAGMRESGRAAAADLYVINTCTVTHKADAESLYLIGKARRENPRALIVVTGCLSSREAKRIRAKDARACIVPHRDKTRIVEKIAAYGAFPKAVPKPHCRGITFQQGRTRVFLKVQDGCSNRCSFCAVRLARGGSRSKPLQEAVAEATRLAENGCREIVLTGICLGSYGRDLQPRASLPQLLRRLDAVDGLLRIRLSSLEQGDITSELLEVMASSRKICPHLHLPLQSGSDAVLARMKRPYSSARFLRTLETVRRYLPDIAFTTDVIVGFPGETRADFDATLKVLHAMNPLKVHVFPYSPRKGTYAQQHYPEKLSDRELKERLSEVREVARKEGDRYVERFIGSREEVLVEGRSRRKPGAWEGYTRHYLPLVFHSSRARPGSIILLKINGLEQFIWGK